MEISPPPGVAVEDGRAPAHRYDDVAIVRWPQDDAERRRRAALGQPTLLVLPPGVPPPDSWLPLEDWLREPVDAVELYSRRERLHRRVQALAPVVLDDDGLLRRGPHWVALSPNERRLLQTLLTSQGSLVSRSDLVLAIWPETGVDDHRALDGFVRRARRRIAQLGLAIHTVRGVGFVLEVRKLPT